jgi:hypothetical protein
MTAPEGILSLEGVVANARPNATVTTPAARVRDLLAMSGNLRPNAGKTPPSVRTARPIFPPTAPA